MSDHERFQDLFGRAKSVRGGKWVDQLDPADRALLDEFSKDMAGTMTDGSIKSYRTYLAKAFLGQPLDNDIKSAVRKFEAWVKAR